MVNVYGDNDEPEELAPLEEEEEDEEAQKNKGLKEYEIMSDKEDIYGEKTKGKELSAEEGNYITCYDHVMPLILFFFAAN